MCQDTTSTSVGRRADVKKGGRDIDVGIPWVTMPGTDRDLIIDRLKRDLVPLLSDGVGAGGGPAQAAGDASRLDVEAPPALGKKSCGRKAMRTPKPQSKIYSTKTAGPVAALARRHLLIGVNEVARAVERDEVALFIICRDVKPVRVIDHLAIAARVRGVPFVVMPKATQPLGAALGLKRIAALGFRTAIEVAKGPRGGNASNELRPSQAEDVAVKIGFLLQFLQQKDGLVNRHHSAS